METEDLSKGVFNVPQGTKFPRPEHFIRSKNLISTSRYSDVYRTKYYTYLGTIRMFRYCAAKVIKEQTNEYQIVKDIQHPNILVPLGIYEDLRWSVVYYPWMSGGTLEDWSRNQTEFSETTVQYIFNQMQAATAYCHSIGMMHQDLKLENFLLTDNLHIKLSDFGFAIYHGPEPSMDQHGTPIYMAPEILWCSSHTYSADVWSLGVCLYHLIYKQTPFNHALNIDDLRQIVRERIVYPVSPTISDECLNLMRIMLRVNSEERIKSSDIAKHAWLKVDDSTTQIYHQDIRKNKTSERLWHTE